MRINRKVLGGLMIASVIGSLLVARPLGAAPDVSLQTWTCNGIPATIVGTPAGETLRGTSGVDVIVAREGNDTIRGLGGDDIICAGKGNDIVYGGAGFDILYGAQGNDVLYAKNGPTAFQRADNRGARMFGGADDDKIFGSSKWDRMQGGPGNDQLFGFEGRDWLRAGPGNDAVDGGPGIDDQHGGNGRDDIRVTTGDIVRGGAGLDLCRVTGEPALLRSCGRNIRETPPQVTMTITTDTTLTRRHYGPIIIAADNVTLDCDGHTITGPGTDQGDGAGIDIVSRSGVTVDNCHVTNFFQGIGVDGCCTPNFVPSNDVAIINSSANANGAGIVIQNASATLTDNVANDNNSWGFILHSFGIVTNGSTLTGNTAINNQSFGFVLDGALPLKESGNLLDANYASGSEANFFMSGSENNVWSNNVAERGGIGFGVAADSSNNTITGNTARDTLTGFDDPSVGAGTGGTGNNYAQNGCTGNTTKSSPAGLC